MTTVDEVVGALKYLEGRFGSSPSIAEVAEQVGVSAATTFKHLKKAKREGIIVQRRGQFMTREVARAFDEQKEKQTKGKG